VVFAGRREVAPEQTNHGKGTGPLEAKATRWPGYILHKEVFMRKATVTYTFRDNDCIPMIRLRGKWLQLAGFEEGRTVQVEVGAGRIMLTLVGE
jgi:hypothetical protein